MDQPPQIPEPQAPISESPQMSLPARLLNIFATPGEVFEDVRKSKPTVSNWLVPSLIMAVLGIIATFVILSQPAIIQHIREQQQAYFDKSVQSGKMTQAQADRTLDAMQKFSGPAIMKITGSIASVAGSFIAVFWWAFLLWLIGRLCLKAPVGFLKMAEVSGLASVIMSLEVVVKLLLAVSLSNPAASPSLALLLKDPQPGTALFTLFSFLDIMTFWVLAVRAIGLSKFAGVSFGKAALWILGVWFLEVSALTGFQATMQAAFGGMK